MRAIRILRNQGRLTDDEYEHLLTLLEDNMKDDKKSSGFSKSEIKDAERAADSFFQLTKQRAWVNASEVEFRVFTETNDTFNFIFENK